MNITQPFEGPVKVLASGDKLLPLPAEMRNLTIELAGELQYFLGHFFLGHFFLGHFFLGHFLGDTCFHF